MHSRTNLNVALSEEVSSDESEISLSKEDLRLAAAYEAPSLARSLWQFVSTFALFGLAVAAMAWSLSGPYLYTVLLGVLAGGLLLRIFIIQHDCGHGSFFESRELNDYVGSFCSLFTLIPYFYWRRQHAIHHASNGNLDHRGHGDMDISTVAEYQALSKFGKLRYRVYRNPIMFLLFGPIFFVLFINRFAFDHEKTSPKERRNVHLTNATMILAYLALSLAFGWMTVLKIAFPLIYTAAAGGIWLFYIQHQFEHTYWRWDDEWDYVTAAMQGSSFYKLPKILQWLTGSIGYHHIHHLKPNIPNYLLQRCHEENPEFQRVVTITLWSSLQTMFLSLWDEERKRLISFREYARHYGNRQALQ
ncbi:MAG: fatty acid desaturase [Deltaproteobacteria bacterium]|nr:fatty acid desaturase [Deltaproteobacteria bacterium]